MLAQKWRAQLDQATHQPYEFVKQQMRTNQHRKSYLSQALDAMGSDPDPHMDHIHRWSAFSMYAGGADTTVASMMSFFLAMMVFPDVQKKAQEEIDRVIGTERLPTSADLESLPYVEAVMKETHRWNPIGPLALPHMSSEEDTIAGYRIPKGSLMIPNIWYVGWLAADMCGSCD